MSALSDLAKDHLSASRVAEGEAECDLTVPDAGDLEDLVRDNELDTRQPERDAA